MTKRKIKLTPSPNEYTEDYFLKNCGGYKDYLHGEIPQRHMKALQYLRVNRGEVILDIGCGRGELLSACDKKGAIAIGIDYSPAAVKISRGDKDAHVAVIQASATALPFRDGIFDKIIMLDIVEHLAPDDLLKCLQDARRLLKHGGHILIHTPNQWGDYVSALYYKVGSKLRRPKEVTKNNLIVHNYDSLHVNVLSPISLRKVIRRAGFRSKIWFAGHPLQDKPYRWIVADKLLFFLTTMWCRAYKV
jgi:SAM-dependent methyltransferase